MIALRDDVDYNLAIIPHDFDAPKNEDFDPGYMSKFFELGYSMAAKGYPWSKIPPYYDPPDDAEPVNPLKEIIMKILALNSSPRSEGQSKTELMLTHLVNGMQEAGAEVETVHLREKTIRDCLGCFTCWTKTPGTCIHKDDMTKELFPKWLEADLVVYASPLYYFHLNAAMKSFLERTLPS